MPWHFCGKKVKQSYICVINRKKYTILQNQYVSKHTQSINYISVTDSSIKCTERINWDEHMLVSFPRWLSDAIKHWGRSVMAAITFLLLCISQNTKKIKLTNIDIIHSHNVTLIYIHVNGILFIVWFAGSFHTNKVCSESLPILGNNY